ncbi:MAG: alpha/beta fold hydrolase, partial [Polymorphobacter sp.]
MLKLVSRSFKALLVLVLLLVGAGAGWQQWATRADARRFPPPGEQLAVGYRALHIRCVGQGAPTVLMLSGSGTPSVASYGVQDRIAGFTRVCSYDRAGLGWSEPAPLPMTLAAMTDDLQRLLRAAGETEPLVLVPESFGGLVALSLLQREPDRVAGAVLVDASEPRLWQTVTGPQIPEIRLRSALMTAAWHIGLVRAVYPWAKPTWVDRRSATNRAWMQAIWSRPIPAADEVVAVYRSALVTGLPAAVPGAMGAKPLVVLQHGRRSAMLGAAFEPGWPAAQRQLAQLSSN